MEYAKATEKDLEQISKVVEDTIQEIYPKYYPEEVVDFFCELHCRKNIFEDIKCGSVGILRDGNMTVGTENQICLQYDTAYLDASLPAVSFYEKGDIRLQNMRNGT